MNNNLNNGNFFAISNNNNIKAISDQKHAYRHSMFVGSTSDSFSNVNTNDDDDTSSSDTSLNTLLTTAFAAQLARLNSVQSMINSSKYNVVYKSHCNLNLPPTKIPVKINNNYYNTTSYSSRRSPPPQLSTRNILLIKKN